MAVGYVFGLAAMPFMRRRRKVIVVNIKECFPERSKAWRALVGVGHQALLGRFALDHSLLLAASHGRLRRLVRVEGLEHLKGLEGRPAILLAPHTLGLDHGGVRLNLDQPFCSLYTPQSGSIVDLLVLLSRTRLAKSMCLISSRGATMKQSVSVLKAGGNLYYLGDIDKSHRSKIVFIPFLGQENAATMTTLPRLARLTDAAVLPCVTTVRGLGGYTLRIGEPWEDFPSGDDEKDMRRYNEFVGKVVLDRPTQYYWPHRRFKSRPQGEPDLYA